MSCKCGSDRIISVCTKSSDRNFIKYKDQEYDGYVPHMIGIGGGDYVDFKYCADCGCIQSTLFPLPQAIDITN